MNRVRLVLISLMTMALLSSFVLADISIGLELSVLEKAQPILKKSINDLCSMPPTEGGSQSGGISVEAEVRLKKLFKNLADMEVGSAGSYVRDSYKGLPREALANAIRDTLNCRTASLKILLDALNNNPPPPTAAPKPKPKPVLPKLSSIAKLEITGLEPSDNGVLIKFLLINSDAKFSAYITDIRAVSICTLEIPTDCKNPRKGLLQDAAKMPYTELEPVTMSEIHSISGGSLNSGYLQVLPFGTDGYFFRLTQEDHKSFVAKIYFRYSIGMNSNTGESQKIIAVRFDESILTPLNAPSHRLSYILASDIKEAREFVLGNRKGSGI